MSRRLSVSLQQHVHQEQERLVRAMGVEHRRGGGGAVEAAEARWESHVENVEALLAQAPDTEQGRAYTAGVRAWVAERRVDMRLAGEAERALPRHRAELEHYAAYVDSAVRSRDPDQVRERVRELTGVVAARAPSLRLAGDGAELLASLNARVSKAVARSVETVREVDAEAARLEAVLAKGRARLDEGEETLALAQYDTARLGVKRLVDRPGHAAVPSCARLLATFMRLEADLTARVGAFRVRKFSQLSVDEWWVIYASDTLTEEQRTVADLLLAEREHDAGLVPGRPEGGGAGAGGEPGEPGEPGEAVAAA